MLPVGFLSRPVCAAGLMFSLVLPRQSIGADFLVVENVQRLQIYNKYQQETTGRELQPFVPFIPMRVLKPNDLMGDGFSSCMQVEIDGQIFYLLKDKNGKLIRSGPLGHETTFSNTTIVLDTVQILSENSIQFKPIGSPGSYLPTGTTVVTVFRHRGSVYSRTLTTPAVFGWITFNAKGEGKSWKVVRRSSTNAVHSAWVARRVQNRMGEVNRLLVRTFGFFTDRTNIRKHPPRWNVEASDKAILCTLRGADDPGDFEQSTFYLVNEIENVVLGSAFEVTHSPGRIEIRRK